MARRFFSDRDVSTFSTINKSLMGKVVGSTCIVYKISSEETQTNVYGESTGMGKIYNPGVELDALIDSSDFDWNTDEFGPDAQQTVTFSFLRNNFNSFTEKSLKLNLKLNEQERPKRYSKSYSKPYRRNRQG